MLEDFLHRYAGPAWAWLVNAVLMLTSGVHPLTLVATICTIWWTVERARTERAKRRLTEMQSDSYAEYVAANRGTFGRLLDRLTNPGELKD
jgi:hypothetical protein